MRRRELLLLLASGTMGARAVRAQQEAMPVVGLLHFGSPGVFASQVAGFRRGLIETGYVEDKT